MTICYTPNEKRNSFSAYKNSYALGRDEWTTRSQSAPSLSSVRSPRHERTANSSLRVVQRERISAAQPVRSPYVRRVLLGVLISLSVIAVLLPAHRAFGGRSLVSSGRSGAEVSNAQNAAVKSVVVKPGDTLWSVARELEPNRDPRKVVDELVKARGTSNVIVGETIEWGK